MHLLHERKIIGRVKKRSSRGIVLKNEKKKRNSKIEIERENWDNITEQKISKVDEETKVLLKMC